MNPVQSDPMFPWYIWWLMVIGLFLMTFIGTYIVTRRWDE